MAEAPWTLRILSGVHAGAEAALSEEEAVLGRDDDCDFVLDDAGLAGRHFSLRADAGGVGLRVLDADRPVLVDGQSVAGSVALEPYQVVAVGGLALAVGPSDRPWPDIALPAAASPGADAEPDDETAPADTERGAADAEPTPDDPAPAEVAVAAGRRRRWAAWAGTAAAGLLVAGAVAWLLLPREVDRHHEDAADTTRTIRAIAAGHDAVIDVRTDDGAVSVTGNVDTEEARSELLAELAGAGVRATVHITSTEQIAEFALAILDQSLNLDERNAVEVAPVSGSPGKLLISGYVRDEAALDRARAILERDVQEARGIAYQVQTKADRLATLRERLETARLGGRFLVQEFADRIGLFGALRSPDELSDLTELVARFNDEFGGRPRLALAGTDSFLGESTIDLDVRAVVLGENIHVVLHDGETHGQGSRVADGYAIRAITEHYMLLERASDRIEDRASESEVAYFIFEER